jgi:hypothetical protein
VSPVRLPVVQVLAEVAECAAGAARTVSVAGAVVGVAPTEAPKPPWRQS